MPKTNLNPQDIHYRNVGTLQRLLTPSGRIMARSKTGLTAKLQRKLAKAIKRARHMALLPFVTQ